MAKKEAKKYTSADVVEMIRTKFSPPAYAVLEQVAAGTGAGTNSWIDAAAFSLWPSNGIHRSAFEVKVSRADFLNELNKPGKNEWAREHFDFFWYAVAPGVAKEDEVPTGCGLMAVRGGGLSIVKQAPRREDVKTDKWIIASFARSLDTERERFLRVGHRELLEKSHEYREAKRWQDGAIQFLRQCGDRYFHPNSADDVAERLAKVTSEKTPESEAAEHAMQLLSKFQTHVLHFLLGIAPLANHLLTERDQLGEFLVKTYGGKDEDSAEELRKALKIRKKDWTVSQRKKLAAAREAIAAV